jgi:hypothetical protein
VIVLNALAMSTLTKCPPGKANIVLWFAYQFALSVVSHSFNRSFVAYLDARTGQSLEKTCCSELNNFVFVD